MNYLLTGTETERLKFRLLEKEDFDTWKVIFDIRNVSKYLDLDPTLTTDEMCEFWFNKAFKRYKDGAGGMNVLIDKKSNQLIGQCGLLVQTIEQTQRLEIGYSILPNFWNRGYATEAAQKCKDHAFENNLSNSLISMVHFENISSEKVALKNGMTLEKKIGDYNIFGIEKKDWRK